MKIKPFSEEQIIERLKFDNSWWQTKVIPAYYKQWKRRLYFDLFYDSFTQKKLKRAVVLMGPRRVGKTVLLYQSIQKLIDSGIPPQKICYVSVETPIYNNIGLEQLFNLCRKAIGDKTSEGFFIFFDEIQYLKDWEVHLKSLVDSFHETKFIVSGSAAAALKLKSNESGAGRFTDFTLPPLTFHEYIHLKDQQHLVQQVEINDPNWGNPFVFTGSYHYEVFNQHFLDYINFGGYPEVVFNPQIQSDPGQYIRNDIIDKVLLRDLPSLYGIRDVQELNALFNVIAYNTGNEFNLEELSKQSGVDKITIKKYIEYLQAAFLIKVIYPVGINTKRFLRAARFKIYLTNPSMRCALFAPIKDSSEFMGQMVETAIFSQWMHWGEVPLHYAAWNNGEVDMVMTEPNNKAQWVLEVKWSNLYFERPGQLKSLVKYCKENNKTKAFATSINQTGVKNASGVWIMFFPAASYCYQVGRNSLDIKKQQLLLGGKR